MADGVVTLPDGRQVATAGIKDPDLLQQVLGARGPVEPSGTVLAGQQELADAEQAADDQFLQGLVPEPTPVHEEVLVSPDTEIGKFIRAAQTPMLGGFDRPKLFAPKVDRAAKELSERMGRQVTNEQAEQILTNVAKDPTSSESRQFLKSIDQKVEMSVSGATFSPSDIEPTDRAKEPVRPTTQSTDDQAGTLIDDGAKGFLEKLDRIRTDARSRTDSELRKARKQADDNAKKLDAMQTTAKQEDAALRKQAEDALVRSREIEDTERSRLRSLQARFDELVNDPRTWWDKASTSQKASAFISATMQGMLAGFQGRPIGQLAIERAIEQDSRDKARLIQSVGAGLGTQSEILNSVLRSSDNEQSRFLALRSLGRQNFASQITATADAFRGKRDVSKLEIEAAMQREKADLDMASSLAINVAEQLNAQGVGGLNTIHGQDLFESVPIPFTPGDKISQKEAFDRAEKANEAIKRPMFLLGQLKEARDLWNQSKLLPVGSKEAKELRLRMAGLLLTVKNTVAKTGAATTEVEIERFINPIFPVQSPSALLDNLGIVIDLFDRQKLGLENMARNTQRLIVNEVEQTTGQKVKLKKLSGFSGFTPD